MFSCLLPKENWLFQRVCTSCHEKTTAIVTLGSIYSQMTPSSGLRMVNTEAQLKEIVKRRCLPFHAILTMAIATIEDFKFSVIFPKNLDSLATWEEFAFYNWKCTKDLYFIFWFQYF